MTEQPYTPEESINGEYKEVQLDTLLSNKTYDRLKWVALVLLPALAALYLGLAPLWDLPKQEAVTGTIVLVDTFLGVLLGLTSKQYRQETEGNMVGYLDVADSEDGKKVGLNFPGDPNNIDQHDKVTFKVRKLSS